VKAARTKEDVFMELLNEWYADQITLAWNMGDCEEDVVRAERIQAEWINDYKDAK
jgi:hypothetical protein